jgi:hypothetical protein
MPKFAANTSLGSGRIEAGCRTVIASRFKGSGMFCTLQGAYALLAFRCCDVNGRFESYWDRRARGGRMNLLLFTSRTPQIVHRLPCPSVRFDARIGAGA